MNIHLDGTVNYTNSPFVSTIASWTDCFGTLTYANGAKLVGEFKDGKRHWQGTFTFSDKRIEAGICQEIS